MKSFYQKSLKIYNSLLILLVFLNILYFFFNFEQIKDRYMLIEYRHQSRAMLHDRWELVNLVPPDAPVMASFTFLAPLSQRKDLFAFHKMYDPNYQNDQGSYKLPANVRYLLVDFNDPWLADDMFKHPELIKARLDKFFIQNKWIVKRRYGKIVLYERRI